MWRGVVATCMLAGCRLGFDDVSASSTIDAANDGSLPITSIALTFNSTCVVRPDTSLWCWGTNAQGQLGTGTVGGVSTVPVNVSSGWRAVTGGGNRHCAQKLDGSIWCWGEHAAGSVATPTLSYPGAWDLFATGRYETFAATPAGIDEWGIQITPQPVNVTRHPLAASLVEAFDRHYCALVPGSGLYCWGANVDGQVGDNSVIDVATPTLVAPGEWIDVGVGHPHTCAIRADGTLWCWGGSGDGATGLTSDVFVPTQVGTDVDWWQLGVGGHGTCALKRDGSLWRSEGMFVERAVGTRWTSIEGGESHHCAIQADHSVWCFGNNDTGQLGIGNMTSINLPMRVGLPDL